MAIVYCLMVCGGSDGTRAQAPALDPQQTAAQQWELFLARGWRCWAPTMASCGYRLPSAASRGELVCGRECCQGLSPRELWAWACAGAAPSPQHRCSCHALPGKREGWSLCGERASAAGPALLELGVPWSSKGLCGGQGCAVPSLPAASCGWGSVQRSVVCGSPATHTLHVAWRSLVRRV